MVLSRRVAVLLVALGVLGLGMMGVLVAVGFASSDPAHPNAKARTLTVVTKTREVEVVDLKPPGSSHGDLRVVNAPLYDASGKERIGRFDLLCVQTDPADEPAEKAHMAQCMKTFTLPGGEISVQGLDPYPKFAALPPEDVDAVSGGTGKYAGVQGEQRFESRGTKGICTFHFVG